VKTMPEVDVSGISRRTGWFMLNVHTVIMHTRWLNLVPRYRPIIQPTVGAL
jgi:hypothetical protein